MKSILSFWLCCFISINSFAQINFGEEQIISGEYGVAADLFAADMDQDGDLDILSASDYEDKIVWYENIDGLGNFGEKQIISTNTIGAVSVQGADLDQDGDMDVLSASYEDNKIAWYKNIDGLGNFGEQQVIATETRPSSVYAADIDGDGDMDVMATYIQSELTVWFENINGQGNFSEPKTIHSNASWAQSISAADIDDDGDLDALSAYYLKVGWNENLDGLGNFGPMQNISTGIASLHDVAVAGDLDGDGDLDVISDPLGDLVWHENLNGLGNFGDEQIINTMHIDIQSVVAEDLDQDGDVDILFASWTQEDRIGWFENLDGLGNFSEEHIITTNGSGVRSVLAVDLDQDGDLDVINSSNGDSKIVWFDNLEIVSSTPSITKAHFSIFPNPTTDNLTIDSKTRIDQIQIYNRLGQLVLSNVNTATIDLSNLPQDLYFCKVNDGNGDFVILKVIKQ